MTTLTAELVRMQSNDTAVAEAGFASVTRFLRVAGKSWRTVSEQLPSNLQSRRLVATVGIMDHENSHQAMVAMRHATRMIAEAGSSWQQVLSGTQSAQPPSNHRPQADAELAARRRAYAARRRKEMSEPLEFVRRLKEKLARNEANWNGMTPEQRKRFEVAQRLRAGGRRW